MAVHEKTELFERMPVRKAIAVMAVPTIIAQLINLIYNVVDTFFIGRTGNSYMIAAVSVAYTLFIMTVSFGNLFGIGGGSLIARLAGRGEYEKAKSVSAYSFYGAILSAAAYSAVILIFMDPLLKLLGASRETIGFAKQYVATVVVAGNIPVILSAVLAHLIRNSGYAKQASFGLSMGGLLNIALDPLLMFVILPKGMEVFGAALATLISNIAACLYLLTVYRRIGEKASLSMELKAARSIEDREKRDLYTVGIPSAILTGLFDIANMFLNAQMAAYGPEAVAALGIVMKAERLPNAINIGICQGMLPIVAYNFTSGNRRRMKEVIRTATVWGFIICAVSMALFELLAKTITGVFINTKGSQALAESAVMTLTLSTLFLRIRCLASPFQFMNYRSSFCMQAMGDGRDTLLHAVLRELVFYIPFMFLLNALFGRTGLVFSLLAGEGCGMVCAVIMMRSWMRRNGC